MNDRLRILQFQMMVPKEKEIAIESVRRACECAAREKADILTLPEMFCCPYKAENFPLYAESDGGMIWSACAELSKAYEIYISAGSIPERGADGRIYNTAYVFGRDGRMIAKHRKMHLFDVDVEGGQSFHESDTLSAGNSVTVFNTEFGPIGLCVCYDFRFPELGRLMSLRGARLVLVPAAFNMTTGPAHWNIMFQSQAMFNQYFAIGTAPAQDLSSEYHSWGHSIVVAPWGNIIKQMGLDSGYQMCEIDLAEVAHVRLQLPLLKHRRRDIYKLEEQ